MCSTHLQISPTCRFHPLVDFILLPFLFSGSPTCRFQVRVDFVFSHVFFPFHPQISHTCGFHQLSDFTQFHLTILRPHLPVGSAGFLPNLKSIVPTVADFTNLQISPTFRFHPVSLLPDFTNLQISQTFRFYLVSSDNSETSLTCGLGQIFVQVYRPLYFRFHQLADVTNVQIHPVPTFRFHPVSNL